VAVYNRGVNQNDDQQEQQRKILLQTVKERDEAEGRAEFWKAIALLVLALVALAILLHFLPPSHEAWTPDVEP
jgi:hypothetical protein